VSRAWLLLSFGDERQHAGNPGYLDEPRRVYRYDSFVPNHKQVAEGDFVFIRDHSSLLGIARIEEIDRSEGEKRMFRCPECGTTGFKQRETRRPRYRCNQKHEFNTPLEELVPCTHFSADFGSSFVGTPEALSLQELRTACPRPAGQLAIQEISWEGLAPKLTERFPAVQGLFGRPALEGVAHGPVQFQITNTLYNFLIGESYTRKDIYEILRVPEELRRGDWNTGYHLYEGSYFLFVNVGSPGRTGHDYTNRFEGDKLVWYGKTGAKLSHPSIQELLKPERDVYVFYREKPRAPFTYAGLGQPARVEDVVPVQVVWEFGRPVMAPPEQLPQEVSSAQVYVEGSVTKVLVNVYERNAAARKICIDRWGCRCQICGFDFERVYGELGRGFIHVHHLKPLSEIGESYKLDPIADLRPVCPNCHAMLHRTSPPLTIDALKSMFNTSKRLEQKIRPNSPWAKELSGTIPRQ
jgi:5-methylcytosine-specific restriction enzyme A